MTLSTLKCVMTCEFGRVHYGGQSCDSNFVLMLIVLYQSLDDFWLQDVPNEAFIVLRFRMLVGISISLPFVLEGLS